MNGIRPHTRRRAPLGFPVSFPARRRALLLGFAALLLAACDFDQLHNAGADAGAAGAGGAPCAGHALEFNGTSAYATFPRPIENDFTLEAWIKPSPTLAVLAGSNVWEGYGLLYADVRGATNDFGMSLLG